MAVNVTKLELPKDELLMHNGDDITNLHLLIRGKITIYATYGNYTVGAGTIVGLTGSNFGISTYNYVAAEDSVLQSFPCKDSSDSIKICETYTNDYPRFVVNNHRFVGELIRTYLSLLMACRKKDANFALDERINRWELDKYNALSSLPIEVAESYYSSHVSLACAALVEASRFANVLNDACLTMAEFLGINKDYVAPPPKPIEVPIALEDSDVISEGGFHDADIIRELENSLGQILGFSGWDDEAKMEFCQQIATLRNAKDRMSPDEDFKKLKRTIKDRFYELYHVVFKNALGADSIPTAVSMFLNFGYIDEELVGIQNAVDLYKLAYDIEETCNNAHVYTIFNWFKKILWNEKEPSKNGFEQSYEEYISQEFREGRLKGNLPQLLNDSERKLRFEINNMFKQAHYMTHGRVSSFMPVMLSDHVIKPIKEMLVSANVIMDTINHARSIDYSLFYRSRVYSNEALHIGKELVYTEVLPDIILMPCIGSNSVMWQEIEGRNRISSARIMLPILCNSDLPSIVINVLGRYRWDICKRIQGTYWNNFSEPSLTAEYCDYLQFYKKNRELNEEQKQKVRSTLTNCRNNFNEFFAKDYENWILYESRGVGKLNKVARKIMAKYCPFSLKVRNDIRSNPMFTEYVDYIERQAVSKRHHLDILMQALAAKKIEPPREIRETRAFYSK